MAIAEITKIMRHSEGQKLLLGALKQNFSSDDNEVDGGFGKFEQALEGLITTDAENKKLVLDQVLHCIGFSLYVSSYSILISYLTFAALT